MKSMKHFLLLACIVAPLQGADKVLSGADNLEMPIASQVADPAVVSQEVAIAFSQKQSARLSSIINILRGLVFGKSNENQSADFPDGYWTEIVKKSEGTFSLIEHIGENGFINESITIKTDLTKEELRMLAVNFLKEDSDAQWLISHGNDLLDRDGNPLFLFHNGQYVDEKGVPLVFAVTDSQMTQIVQQEWVDVSFMNKKGIAIKKGVTIREDDQVKKVFFGVKFFDNSASNTFSIDPQPHTRERQIALKKQDRNYRALGLSAERTDEMSAFELLLQGARRGPKLRAVSCVVDSGYTSGDLKIGLASLNEQLGVYSRNEQMHNARAAAFERFANASKKKVSDSRFSLNCRYGKEVRAIAPDHASLSDKQLQKAIQQYLKNHEQQERYGLDTLASK